VKESSTFLNIFFSCCMIGKWTAKEKLFHVVLNRTVSHEHRFLNLYSRVSPFLKISLYLRSSNNLFQNIDCGFWDASVNVVI